MTRITMLMLSLLAAGLLTACGNDDTYPVSGEECSPDDPVRTVDAEMTGCVPTI